MREAATLQLKRERARAHTMSPLQTSTSINSNKENRAHAALCDTQGHLLNAHAYRTHIAIAAPHHCIPRRHMDTRKFAPRKCVVRTVGERTLADYICAGIHRRKKSKKKKQTTKNHQHARYKRWYYVQRTAGGKTHAQHIRAPLAGRDCITILSLLCVFAVFAAQQISVRQLWHRNHSREL